MRREASFFTHHENETQRRRERRATQRAFGDAFYPSAKLCVLCASALIFMPQPGPKPAGYTTAPLILPFLPDREGTEEETSVQVKRDQIGLVREQQNTFYPHSAERFAKFNFTLSDA